MPGASDDPVLGRLAHDLNNYLGLVVGNLSMLGEELDALPDAAELARDALDGAMQAAWLIERVLAAAGRQPHDPELLDLEAVLPALAAAAASAGSAITIDVACSADLRPAWVDPARLEQVLIELAANAGAAMPDGGRLVLAADNAAAPDDQVVLTLRDTGAGMTPEVRAQAFDLFFTTKRGVRGAGLGLSMARRLIQQAGGDVELDSEPGKGTAVRIWLPCAPPD